MAVLDSNGRQVWRQDAPVIETTTESAEPCAWCGETPCLGHCEACESCHPSGTYCTYPADDWRSGL